MGDVEVVDLVTLGVVDAHADGAADGLVVLEDHLLGLGLDGRARLGGGADQLGVREGAGRQEQGQRQSGGEREEDRSTHYQASLTGGA